MWRDDGDEMRMDKGEDDQQEDNDESFLFFLFRKRVPFAGMSLMISLRRDGHSCFHTSLQKCVFMRTYVIYKNII